jgi:hypothetical protein
LTQQPVYAELLALLSLTSFRCIISLKAQNHTIYVLERPAFSFPPLIASSPSHVPTANSNANVTHTPTNTPFVVPTLSEWRDLWAAWDLVTLGMIPPGMLHQKPIDLRHKCLFYIGHIPT